MFTKLMTVMRGGLARADDGFTDANAMLILEQEIREAGQVHRRMTQDLATLMAHEMSLRRTVSRLETKLAERTQQTREALDKAETALAEELADRIVHLEDEIAGQRSALAAQQERVRTVRGAVQEVEIRLKRLRQRQAQVRDTQVMQRAQSAGAEVSGSAATVLQSAEESLARITATQEAEADKRAALDQLSSEAADHGIDEGLAESGIIPNAAEKRKSVLDRIKAQQTEETKQ